MKKIIAAIISVSCMLVTVLGVPGVGVAVADSNGINFYNHTINFDFEEQITFYKNNIAASPDRFIIEKSNDTNGNAARYSRVSAGNGTVDWQGNFPDAFILTDGTENGRMHFTAGEEYDIEFYIKRESFAGSDIGAYDIYLGLYFAESLMTHNGTGSICTISQVKSDIALLYTFRADATDSEFVKVTTSFTVPSSGAAALLLYRNYTYRQDGQVIWVDDITLTQKSAFIEISDYSDTGDGALKITKQTTVAGLNEPIRSGFTFEGFYADAGYLEKADPTALVCIYNKLWAKWSRNITVINNYDETDVTYQTSATLTRGSDRIVGNNVLPLSVYSSEVETYTGTQNKALHFYGAEKNSNQSDKKLQGMYPNAVMIYDSNQGNSLFCPVIGDKYRIAFKYRCDTAPTSGKPLRINVAYSGSASGNDWNDGQKNSYGYATGNISTATSGWVDVSVEFTATSSNPLMLKLNSNNDWYSSVVDLWVDDITVTLLEASVTFCGEDNYNESVLVSDTTTFADVALSRAGYTGAGFYADALFNTMINETDLVMPYEKVYVKWERVTVFVNNYDEAGATYFNDETSSNSHFTTRVQGDNQLIITQWNATIKDCTVDATAGKAVYITPKSNNSINSEWPHVISLYNPDTNTPLKVQNGVKYRLTFKYWSETDPSDFDLVVRLQRMKSGKFNYESTYSYGVITEVTDKSDNWQIVTYEFTGNTSDNYDGLKINISSDTYNTASYTTNTKLWIDDITLSEIIEFTCYNYMAHGTTDKTMSVPSGTTYGELEVPVMSGATFGGFYADATMSVPVDVNAVVKEGAEIYARWIEYGNVNEDGENTVDICDLVQLNNLIETEQYNESADLNGDKVLNSDDLDEHRALLLDETVTFTLFSDFHYYENCYMSSIEDIQAILSRAQQSNSQFIMHAGDFCNDYLGSPELMNAYLKQNIPAYGIYGNHETEGANPMSAVTPLLNNREVIWGTTDGKIAEDGSVGYYYFDNGNLRIVATDTNYYHNGTDWVHLEAGSVGAPTEYVATSNSLGDAQLAWLESVVSDAAAQGKKCIIFGHATFNTNWGGASPDAAAVQDIYAKYPGIVMMSINGHYHTNRTQVVDNVLYFDVNTVRNGDTDFTQNHDQYAGYTTSKTYYDEEGNVTEIKSGTIHALNWLAKNTWFFEQPLSTTVTISLKTGKITVENIQTNWLHGIEGPNAGNIVIPEITGGMFKLDK